jgi:hypothetical protein
MIEIKIDKNVPLPVTCGAFEAALRKMQTGDSFAMKGGSRSTVRHHAKKLGVEVLIRQVKGEWRCWKISKA